MNQYNIQKAADAVYDSFWDDHSDAKQLIAQAIREAVVQVLDEVQQLVLHIGNTRDVNQGVIEIYREIRSLKDSLTVEETAQERRTDNESRRIAK